ncbi:MAG: TraR/DksA family transcriptional regulator [Pseudomonadota bacterium]
MKRLTHKQLADLSIRLARRVPELKEEIQSKLAQSDLQHYKNLAGQVSDAADESVASMLIDIDAAIVDRHVGELRDIDAARLRMSKGSYGRCTDCGKAVAYERLEVYPTAKRCRYCQERHEKRYSHQATPSL